MAVRYPITLNVSEPNNNIGLLKIRQADEETQTLIVQILEDALPKTYEGLQVFFCARIGQSAGLGIIEQKLTDTEMTDPKNGKLEYTFRSEDWQVLGRQNGYFSFRKMNNDHEYVQQFSTRDFTYEVTKNIYSDGIKEVKKDGSTYIWTIEDLMRIFNEYIDSGKSNWEEFVDANKEILESIDPGGAILNELIASRKDVEGEAHNNLNERIAADYKRIMEKVNNGGLTNDELSEVMLLSFFREKDTAGKIYYSTDGLTLNNTITSFDQYIRDPSLTYHNGNFYIAHTIYNPQDFRMQKSKNLVDWESIDVSLGLFNKDEQATKIWAPELINIAGEIYVLVSCRVGTSIDKDGKTIDSFRPYLAKAIDLEKGIFDDPILLALPEPDSHDNKIDGTIAIQDGSYHLFIKDEYDKKIEQWTSKDLIVWSKLSDGISTLGDYVEGPAVNYFRGKYYLYVDAYYEKEIYVTTSEDLVNWTGRRTLNVDEPIRHGSGMTVTDPDARKVMNAFMLSAASYEKRHIKKIVFLDSLATNDSIEEFAPINNTLYILSDGYNITVEKLSNKNNAKEFMLLIQSSNSASVNFKKNGNIATAYEASVDRKMNDHLIKFTLFEDVGLFYPDHPQGIKYSNGNHLATLSSSNTNFKGSIRMRRNCNSIELVFENVKFDAMNGTGVIGALPVMYRPAGQRKVRIASDDTGSDQFATIVIEESGEVKVTRTSNLASTYNGNIMYFANE